MTQQNKNAPACAMCDGTGGLQTAGGSVQGCPACDGSGQAYIPGLFYGYASPYIALGANAAQTVFINIVNSPFKWVFSTSIQTGPFTVQIFDGKAQRQFFNTPLYYSLVFGTGTAPFPVLNPWIFDLQSNIQIQLQDLSGNTNNIQLGFIGVQLVASQSQSTGRTASASAGGASMSGLGRL